MTGIIMYCPICQYPASDDAVCHDRCAAHVRQVAAVLARVSAEQRDKALLLITDGAITMSGIPGVWQVVSSDGTTTYPAGATFCGCPSSTACYHNAAVIITAAAAATLAASPPG